MAKRRRLTPEEIDLRQAEWEAYKTTERAKLRAASSGTVGAKEAAEIAGRNGFPPRFDLRARLSTAARDYQAHAALDRKGEVAGIERRERKLLKTLLQRVSSGARPDRVRATLLQLGARGQMRLALQGWTGDAHHGSLATAVARACADAGRPRGRLPSARALWALSLGCIYAEAVGCAPTVDQLSRFVADCSAAASVRTAKVSTATLRRIVRSPAVAHFAAKFPAPF